MLSTKLIDYNDMDAAGAYTYKVSPITILDYIIAAINLKQYLEANWNFRSVEYKIWNLPPDVTSVLTSRPAATGITQSDERGVLLTGLLVTNNFPETIDRIGINIDVQNSASVTVASAQGRVYPSIKTGTSQNLFSQPIFIPTESSNLSVRVMLNIITQNYVGQITHTIP